MGGQYVDAAVSRAKFDRELAEYDALAAEYRKRGWFLTEAHYPVVLVVLAAERSTPPSVVFGVRFDFSNYDAAPPSVQLVNPFTGEAYKFKDLPSPLNRSLTPQEVQLPGMPAAAKMMIGQIQPLMQAHAPDDIPFLCLAGVREYHDHPAHSGDAWELHRASGAGRLVRLLEIIHKYGVTPITGFNVNLVPQVTFAFGQPPQ